MDKYQKMVLRKKVETSPENSVTNSDVNLIKNDKKADDEIFSIQSNRNLKMGEQELFTMKRYEEAEELTEEDAKSLANHTLNELRNIIYNVKNLNNDLHRRSIAKQ
jgi:hypothetical protein